MLAEVTAHPLLSGGELALLLRENVENVQRALRRLCQRELVRAYQQPGGAYHAVTPVGLRYGVAEAGYGRAVQRYARQRGSRRNTRRLLYHLEHTRVTNEFFLRWVELARRSGAQFTWQSEMECHVYFRQPWEWHHWMPGGMGTWERNGTRFRFVVEIDRTRESRANLKRKFSEYYAWEEWRRHERGDEEPCAVLVVTTS